MFTSIGYIVNVPLNRNRFFFSLVLTIFLPCNARKLSRTSKFTTPSRRCWNKKIDPVDRETKHFQSFFDIYLIVLVRTHAWDNKVNVIHHRCASNLSRIFLISWTNDMLSTYNPFILSNRVNVSYIQMNASHEYGSHVARPNFDRFSIFFSSLQEFAQWLHYMM